jgi:hypothetical protein
MPNTSRRDFLIRTGRAGLVVSIGTPLLGACYGEDIYEPTGVYDVIIVGGGAAGVVVATKLQRASSGKKRILIIEAGGPTTAAIGGKAYPPWVPAGRTDLTMFAYRARRQSPGRCSVRRINSPKLCGPIKGSGSAATACSTAFSEPIRQPYSTSGGKRWKWNDVHAGRVRDRIHGRHAFDRWRSAEQRSRNDRSSMYASASWTETDTSRPFRHRRVQPPMRRRQGRSAGGTVPNTFRRSRHRHPGAGLEMLLYTKADRIEFDASERRSPSVTKREASNAISRNGDRAIAQRRVLVMAAARCDATAAAVERRGPAKRTRNLPGSRPAKIVDRLGVGLRSRHAMVTYSYDGPVPYAAYNYGDYTGNAADLQHYLANGSGPYAQYQPVSILNYRAESDIPDVEVFINPNGAGTPGGPYWGPRTFSVFVMLIDPKARGVITLDAKGNVNHPPIYLPETAEGATDMALMTQAVSSSCSPRIGVEDRVRPWQLRNIRICTERACRHPQARHGPSPVDGVHFNRLVTNHWGGTAVLTDGPGGVDRPR